MADSTLRGPFKRHVKVWDEEQEITVYQKSKSVWVAYGVYMGKSIEVTARSDTSAINRWRETARYRGG
jgi:hypothetical protein